MFGRIVLFFTLLGWAGAVTGVFAENSSGGKTIVLEALTIEGKLKRPQVALISLEKRPHFKPIALSNPDVQKRVLEKIDHQIFSNRVFPKPFSPDSK